MLMNQFGKVIGRRHSGFIQSQTYHSKSMRKVYDIFGFRFNDPCSMGSALRILSISSIHHHLPLVQSPLILPWNRRLLVEYISRGHYCHVPSLEHVWVTALPHETIFVKALDSKAALSAMERVDCSNGPPCAKVLSATSFPRSRNRR